MKAVVLAFIGGVLITSAASSAGDVPAADTRNSLSQEQEKYVLNLIDNVCADTRFEGGFVYSFDSLLCNAVSKSCELSLKMWLRKGEDDTVPPTDATPLLCTIQAASSYVDLVESRKAFIGGVYDDLRESVYDQISACLDQAGG